MKRRDHFGNGTKEGSPKNRFGGLFPLKERSPREEVTEILAEGLWSLICQGRGPAAGKQQIQGKEPGNQNRAGMASG